MNVCHIMNYNATYEGNFIASLKVLAEQNEIGNTTFIFFEETEQQEWCRKLMSEGMRIFFISHGNMFHNAKILRKACKDCDILHAHFMSSYFLLLAKIVRPHIKIIVHFHFMCTEKSIKIKELFINKFVDCICGVSKPVYDSMIANGKSKQKCTYINNAIFFNRLDDKSEDYSFENKISNFGKSYLALIFGTHFFGKGCDIAFESIKRLAKTGCNIKLIISTNDIKSTNKELTKLDPNYNQYVKIIQATNNIGAYYRLVNIFLSPSVAEAFCYAIPESIYCGTPVIRSDVEGQNHNIPNDFIVPVGDADALAKKIREVLEIPKEKLSEIVDEQRKVILTSCSIDTWCTKVIQLYQKVLNGEPL